MITVVNCTVTSTYEISVSRREDGGLRIWSNNLPGLVLSGADASAVWRDLGPAIEALLNHK